MQRSTRRSFILAIGLAGLWAGADLVRADAGLQLRLVPLEEGVRGSSRAPEPEIVVTARKAGVDLRNPEHPLLSHSYRNGRLFYLFYKTVAGAHGPQDYLLQRIRKIERAYKTADDPNPTVRETYLVEAFKLRDGMLKRADQHYGSFGIQGYHRREVIKEYEIGFGEIDGVATGKAWPFDRNVLYRAIQDYAPSRELYDQVRFTQARQWKLEVSFTQDGTYVVKSLELGFDAPTLLPSPAPNPDGPALSQ